MAKKPAKKGTAEKSAKKEKTKSVVSAKTVKPAKAKEAKSELKIAKKTATTKGEKLSKLDKNEGSAVVEKQARSSKLTLVSEAQEDQVSTAVSSDSAKTTKAKPKAEKLTAAQKKAEKLSAEISLQWADLHQKYSSEKSQMYDMKSQFEAHKPLQHKVLGWGWIMSVENDRLEVLFQDGKRMLISNYKSR